MADAAFRGTGTQYQFISLSWGCKCPARIIWQSGEADDFPVTVAAWEVAGVNRRA